MTPIDLSDPHIQSLLDSMTPQERQEFLLLVAHDHLTPVEREHYKHEIVNEMLLRARERLIDFAAVVDPGYIVDPFHEVVASYLDAVVAGDIKKLMIFAPPQTGKSHLSSEIFPAYWLARRPNDPVIIASYAAALALDKSRRVREIVEGYEYQQIFPDVRVREGSSAVDLWYLEGHDGAIRASGVGGGLTGFGARLGIIDDPVKDMAEAYSPTMLDKTWSWYRGVFRTRIREGGAIIIMMTRWSEADLAGRILEDPELRADFEVLRIPALAETQDERDANNLHLGLPAHWPDPLGRSPGVSLAPNIASEDFFTEVRRTVGELVWSAQYMGVPKPPEGAIFKRSWFTRIDDLPADVVARVRYWDLAASMSDGDYTVGVRMARTANGLYVVEDVARFQLDIGRRDEAIRAVAEADGPEVRIGIEEEPGSAGQSQSFSLVKLLAGFAVVPDRPTGHKVLRASPFASQANVGNVRMVKGDWNATYLNELTVFDKGLHDDQVDATSGAFKMLSSSGISLYILGDFPQDEQ